MATYKSILVLLFMCFTFVEANDETLIETLVKRLELVEEKGRVQQHRLEQQDILLKAYQERMGTYETQLYEHTVRIQDLEEQLSNEAQDSTDTVAHELPNVRKPPIPNESAPDNSVKSKRKLRSNANRIKKERYQTNSQDGNMQTPSNYRRLVLDSSEGPVAFHATYDKGVSAAIGNGQHLIFEDVHLNLGNAFHPLHGLFIAPKAGLYMFSTSAMIWVNHGELLATIKINGVDIARVYVNGNGSTPEQSSVTIAAQLNVGDEVWVASFDRQSASDYGNKQTVRHISKKNAEGPIGFHATNDKDGTTNIGKHQHIIYEDVHLNLGNGFHKLHGLFIAPSAGVYIFSTSIMSYINSQSEIAVTIMKNGGETARAYGHGDSGRHDQGSVTVLVELAVGDEVWVELTFPTTSAELGGKYTSFMGYLLFPL